MPPMNPIVPSLFDILLKPENSVIEGVEIEEVFDGQRDRMATKIHGGLPVGVLVDSGGVIFRTAATNTSRSKTFRLGFDQFSFLFNKKAGTK